MDERKDLAEEFHDAVTGLGPVIVGIVFMVASGVYVMAYVIAAAVS